MSHPSQYIASPVESEEEDSPPDDILMTMGITPLERTIDRMGMGYYQWALLSLCGLGWMADNMWLQAIAIILPRVQEHYSVPDNRIGWLSTCIFFGMMLGAVGWGTCSDMLGRTTAFNATLVLTSIFGFIASNLANSFVSLCISLFFLGTAVGGSMPTDGTLFLENIPRNKQYLLTGLSVFFSFGAVLAAILGIVIIPSQSCPEEPLARRDGNAATCDVNTQNLGWKYLLMTISVLTLVMFVFRIIFFKLHESPRYLVSAGRHTDAVHSLRRINSYNGVDMDVNIDDVKDDHCDETLFEAGNDDEEGSLTPPLLSDPKSPPSASPPRDYQATLTHDESPLANSSYTPIDTPTSFLNGPTPSTRPLSAPTEPTTLPHRLNSTVERSRRDSQVRFQPKRGVKIFLRNWVRTPLEGWREKVASLLTRESKRTTLLVWAVWCLMSLAYTMFNVYLPKLLESRMAGSATADVGRGRRVRAMWDVVIFTLGGCPGALLGAWMIETRLGRQRSLALSTFATAFFCAVFAWVESPTAVTTSSMAISLAVTTMWAVLYGMTPEIFSANVRGTACGTASALSRIGGMIAPILGGFLLVIDNSFPVYAAVAIFIAAGLCVMALPGDERLSQSSKGRKEGYRSVAH